MTDRQALLASVLAAPDDDAPRLVYADWLEEHGGSELAAMIRWQCHEERRGDVWPFGAGSFALGGKLQSPSWCIGVTLRRGFFESITCTAADWLAHGDAILAEHPVTEVRLTTLPTYEWARENATLDWPTIPGTDRMTNVWDNALRHNWPSVRTWHLPPEHQRDERGRFAGMDMGRIESEGDYTEVMVGNGGPVPMGVIEVEEDAAPSAAPPDNARRRFGHSRMPSWLAEQRARPRRR